MDAVGAIIGAVFLGGFLALLVWCERSRDRIEVAEDRDLQESIKHLPIEKQAEIWATHIRIRAEQDLRRPL